MSSWSLFGFEFAEELWIREIIVKTNIIPNTTFKNSSIPSLKGGKSDSQIENIQLRKIKISKKYLFYLFLSIEHNGWCLGECEKVHLIIEI